MPPCARTLTPHRFLSELFSSICLGALCISQAWAGDGITVLEDFTRHFRHAAVSPPGAASLVKRDMGAGVLSPGIQLGAAPEGASIRFDNVRPASVSIHAKDRVFLVFSLGCAEIAAGVLPSVSVVINGVEIYAEASLRPECHWLALDLTEVVSQGAFTLEFRCNTAAAHDSTSPLVAGDPILAAIEGVESPEALPARSRGLALARVRVAGALTRVEWVLGETRQSLDLPKGDHWLAAPFAVPAPLQVSGEARVEEVLYARHLPHLLVERFALGSPLVLAGEPVNIVLQLRNEGRGDCPAPLALPLELSGQSYIETLAPVPPGEPARLIWKGLQVERSGNYRAQLVQSPPQFASVPIEFHVFPARTDPDSPVYEVSIETEQAQLRFVKDSWAEVYAELFLRHDGGVERAGSIYPLAEGLLLTGGQARAPRLSSARLLSSDLKITEGAAVVTGSLAGVPLELRLEPAGCHIELTSSLRAEEETEVMIFRGPSMLAGDRAYGTDREFAVLPMDGTSSTTPDLPEMPGTGAIIAPLAAVQGQHGLLALGWDPEEAWAAGKKVPGVYLDMPGVGSGFQTSTFYLFAPPNGAYGQQYKEEAFRPYLLPAGNSISLRGHLHILPAMSSPEPTREVVERYVAGEARP